MVFIEFEPLCQKLWVFCQILALFTMPAHQIWSCHVTQDANLENFFLILHLILGKVTKISSGKALYFRRYQLKHHRGGGGKQPSPQVPVGLSCFICYFTENTDASISGKDSIA